MAKEKTNPNWLMEELDRVRDRMGEVVAERWYVVEVTPARYEWGYDGGWTKEVVRKVSPYYNAERHALHFIETHDPDRETNYFKVKSQKLYERTIREWR